MRLIDADALIEHIRKDPLFELVDRYGIVGIIASRPTIEAEPVKRGRWIGIGRTSVTCSECGEWTEVAGNYCPNCGAKMG